MSLSTSISTLLQSLNPEQAHAVTLPNEHALILAGAGSGKTRVLTTRIAWLLEHGHVGPSGILAVTFTNKAAKEMMARLSSVLSINVRNIWMGTFHGLCHRFLRAHYQLAGLPQTFQIMDMQDQLSAVKRLCRQWNIDDQQFPPKQLAWFFSACKDDGKRPKDVEAHDPATRKKVELYQLYEDQCQREGVVDFSELMLRSYEVLRDHEALRQHYQQRFQHILIDEFQDTNRLQYAWLKMFTGQGASLFAVGDDDQSIYAFRGARVGNMTDFVSDFSVQHQIRLEQNYRSYSNILDSANELISHNAKRLGKNLRTDQGAGEPVRVFEATGDLAEAKWLVEEARLLQRDGMSLSEIAVLYRSNAQSRVLETALFNAGMPYRVYGGLRFFERAEIKHALAYLRLMENPADDSSFLRVVNFPPRGIGARSVEQLQDVAQQTGVSLYAAVSHMGGKVGATIGGFVAKIDVMREQALHLGLSETIQLVLKHSGLLEHYQLEREGQDRLENLEELVSAAESFVTMEGFGKKADNSKSANNTNNANNVESSFAPAPALVSDANAFAPGFIQDDEVMSPLAAFLSHASLEAGDNMAQTGQEAVQLMTVHASKGLEFDAVFITGLEEGLFPHDNAQSDRDGLEEERRLMYVAMTRARQRLYLSFSQTRLLHGQTRYGIKSRFLDELPEVCLRWLTPKKSRMQGGWGSGGYGNGGGYAKEESSFVAHAPQKSIAPKSAEGHHGMRVGTKVFHAKFGEGSILTLEGQGADARAQIRFNRHGLKWLALGVAKLEVI